MTTITSATDKSSDSNLLTEESKKSKKTKQLSDPSDVPNVQKKEKKEKPHQHNVISKITEQIDRGVHGAASKIEDIFSKKPHETTTTQVSPRKDQPPVDKKEPATKKDVKQTVDPFVIERQTLAKMFDHAQKNSIEETINNYCAKLIKKSHPRDQDIIKGEIGQIVFLYDRKVDLTNVFKNPNASMQISDLFHQETAKMNNFLKNLYAAYPEQADGNDARQEWLSRILAQSLITSANTSNIGIAKFLKEDLLKLQNLAYQKDIIRILDTLTSICSDESDAAKFNDYFLSLKLPINDNSAKMIRAIFRLDRNAPITSNHLKQAFLYFCMGHARQGSVGNCFAEWWAIFVKEGLWETMCEDGISILKNGSLSRILNGNEKVSLPFCLSLSDDALDKPFTLNQNQIDKYLAHPGIVNAALQMGIDLSSKKEALVNQLFGKNGETQTTYREIISMLAKLVPGQSGAEEEALAQDGFYGFSAEKMCAPLAAYTSSIAAFAEADKNSYVRSQINHAVSTALHPELSTTHQWRATSVQKIHDLFSETFNNGFTIEYKDSVQLGHVASDGSSHAGAFIMVRNDNEQAIASITQFQQFVLDVCQIVKTKLGKTDLDSQDNAYVQRLAKKIHNYVTSTSFLRHTLWTYDPSTRKFLEPEKHINEMEHLPWQDATGDSNVQVIQIAIGKNLPPPTSVVAKNALQLGTAYINFAKDFETKEKPLETQGFSGLVPVNSENHAFNGLIKDNMIEAIHSKDDPTTYLKQRLLAPITPNSASNSPHPNPNPSKVSPGLQQEIIQAIEKYLPEVLEVVLPFAIKEISGLIGKKEMTVQQFSHKLLKTLHDLHPTLRQHHAYSQLTSVVHTEIMSAVDTNHAIQKASFDLFDSNWVEGTDLTFCLTVNPQNEIVFGLRDENGKITILPQNEWMGQKYDFYPIDNQMIAKNASNAAKVELQAV